MTIDTIEMDNSGVVLAIADSAILRTCVLKSIQKIYQEGKTGVIISLSEPQIILKKALEKNSVDTSTLFFIDGVTESAMGKAGTEENCFYVNKSSDLTGIGIAITKAMALIENKENMVIILDSVSTLLIYNDPNLIIRFLHMLVNKVRLNDAIGVLFSAKNAIDPIVTAQITAFSDSVMYFEK
ncbi:MAG: hypothetical protein GX097_03090 [Methanomicrobiales archaeon]|nr:hypothetical protein [Methanomicrobiales archaeon]